MSREDAELQILEHLRALRQEVAALHQKVDRLGARSDDAATGDEAEGREG